jgi:hypothetical protein
MIVRRNMRCWVTVGKHVNDIRTIARQPPITTIDKLLEAVFSVVSTPRIYSEDPRQCRASYLNPCGGGYE